MNEDFDTNFSHLMLLYEETCGCALEIKRMISEDDLDNLADVIESQEEKVQKVIQFEKHVKSLSKEQIEEQLKIKDRITSLQKENIETLKMKQEEIKKNIVAVSKELELKKAYTFSDDTSGSSIDISE